MEERKAEENMDGQCECREGTVGGGSVAHVRATWRRNNRTPTSHKSGTQFRRKKIPRIAAIILPWRPTKGG